MAQEFAGKSVLITGAASGIGKAAAFRWANEGAKVCIADMDVPRAEKVAEDIRAAGGEAFATKVDVSSQQDNDRMVAETVEKFGKLDIAFLNAGYYGPGTSFDDDDITAFARIIAINLRGCFLGIRAVGKAIASGETEGVVKTLFDARTGALVGAHMIGAEGTEMIQGFALAMTLEATEAEIMATVFPHPTMSEAMHEAALDAYGQVLHL